MKQPVPRSAAILELWARHRRPLFLLLRALLPSAADAESAWRETLVRMAQGSRKAPASNAGNWAVAIAVEVAAERRRSAVSPLLSDDLVRQLVESAEPALAVAADRPAALRSIIARLPPSEVELLRQKHGTSLPIAQIAAGIGRTPTAVARELTNLHTTLVSALHDALPRDGPPPPGGAADIGRLTDQLLDGNLTDDGRIVLETLLLADVPAQAHYHRHVALTLELDWMMRGEPKLPDLPATEPRRVSRGEWTVTIVFVVACIVIFLFVILQLAGYWRRLPG